MIASIDEPSYILLVDGYMRLHVFPRRLGRSRAVSIGAGGVSDIASIEPGPLA
jgi:hypothetical protein